jgi:integrase
MLGTARGIFSKTKDRVDDALWRGGAWLRLRNDPMAALVPAEFRRDGRYVVGRKGRMFLARDSSRVLDQHAGRAGFDDGGPAAWADVIARRAAALEQHGCAYAVLIPPNAHSVYPEDLPRRISTAPRRPVHELLSHLSRHVPHVPVVYPLAELVARKRTTEVFPRTETHWNEVGAFVAYRALLDALPQAVPMRRLDEDDVWYFELSGPGDLGIKRRLPAKSPHLFAYPRHPDARLVSDNMVEGTGNVIVTECPVAPRETCVVFGDSYSFGLLPFLAETFGRLVFAQAPAIDMELVERERPGLVLTVTTERFLLDVPDDESEIGVEERALAKAATGSVRARMDRWDHERHYSPAAVEWIRARMLAEGWLEDAMLVSVLAYAGLRPVELQWLRWRHVGERTLRAPTRPPGKDAPTAPRHWPSREIRLLEPLRRDLSHWRSVADPGREGELVFPSPFSGGPWAEGEWQRWADERYSPLVQELALEPTGPGGLQHTFAALSIHAGATASELAAELGEDPHHTLAAHAYGIEHAARAGYVPAGPAIDRARELAARTVAPQAAAARGLTG